MRPDRESAGYTFVFAFVVCVACGLVLSFVAQSLRARQEFNAALEVRKSILQAARVVPGALQKVPLQEINSLFERNIRSVRVDSQGGVQAFSGAKDQNPSQEGNPLYIYHEQDRPVAYIFPVEGSGLWGQIHGFLALEADGITVRGLAFSSHSETPGLGGEIDKESFLKGFYGKKIWDEKSRQLVSVTIAKGRAADRVGSERLPYYVDGISGATLTGDGINVFLKDTLLRYKPFLARIRVGERP
jgi:Na+-transporting NADH:ubiquinone oxidoreductase subunit C